MKRLIITLVTLIGLTANAQTVLDSTVFLTSSQAEIFLNGGSVPTGIKMFEGGGFKFHEGVTFGFDFEDDVIYFTIEETGIVYIYDLVPNSVRYKTKEGFVKTRTKK